MTEPHKHHDSDKPQHKHQHHHHHDKDHKDQEHSFDDFAEKYDEMSPKIPYGFKLYWMKIFTYFKGQLDQLRVCDIGGGTGRHLELLLNAGIGFATLVDGSKGMTKVANRKLEKFVNDKKLTIITENFPSAALETSSFDIVLLNFVLHHLENSDQFFNEILRILKPGGLLILSDILVHQAREGIWYTCPFDPTFVETWMEFCTLKQIKEYLSNFNDVEVVIPVEESMFPLEQYENYDGVFDPKWRSMAMIWFSLSDEETEKALGKVREMKENGTWEKVVNEREKRRKEIGQGILFFAHKQK